MRNSALSSRTHLAVLSLLFIFLHTSLFFYDASHPDAVLAGDRALSRIGKIHYVFYDYYDAIARTHPFVQYDKYHTFFDRLLQVGDPGDFAIHGIIYYLYGFKLVIIVQILLSLVSLFYLYKMIVMFGGSPPQAFLGTLTFMLLPGSLMTPHLLVSEAIYNPLVLISVYFLIKSANETTWKNDLLLASLIMAICISIRIQLVFYPIIAALMFFVFSRETAARRTPVLVVSSLLFPVAWTLFYYHHTGHFGMGPRDYALPEEFFETARRISTATGQPWEPSRYPGGEMSLSEFSSWVLEYPFIYLRIEFLDLLNTYLNVGVNQFLGYYLHAIDYQETLTYWRDVRDRGFIPGVVVEIIRSGGVFPIVFLAATFVWGVFLLLVALGGVALIRDDRVSKISKALLVSYLAYATLTLHAASNSRWTYRTHFEFVLMVFFVASLSVLARFRQKMVKTVDRSDTRP